MTNNTENNNTVKERTEKSADLTKIFDENWDIFENGDDFNFTYTLIFSKTTTFQGMFLFFKYYPDAEIFGDKVFENDKQIGIIKGGEIQIFDSNKIFVMV